MFLHVQVFLIAVLVSSGHASPDPANGGKGILKALLQKSITGKKSPDAAKSDRGIVKYPLLQKKTTGAATTAAKIISNLTQTPLAVAASLTNIDLPSIITTKNIAELSRFVTDLSDLAPNEDAKLSFSELITKYGFPLETHTVTTEDKYILTLYRIPGEGPVTFLMHGLAGSSDDYVVTGPEGGLAYLLARAGYDVWLGNARGNKHSRQHAKHKPSEAIFWDFSFHEIGYYDLPAMIDYVLKETKQEKVKYVGHSQGTATFFVMTSERPKYNKKISVMVALSPIAFMSHSISPLLRLIALTTPIADPLYKALGLHEFLPDVSLTRNVKLLLCGTGRVAENICKNVMFLVYGFGYEHQDVKNLPVIFGHVPAGASTKQVLHFTQGIASRNFQQYNYGVKENRMKYGTDDPPQYNLSNIIAPVALFYSDKDDWMAQPVDVQELYSKLGNVVDYYKVPSKQFNHLDFIWAKKEDFIDLIYNKIIELFEKF